MLKITSEAWFYIIVVVVALVLVTVGGIYIYRSFKRQNNSHLKSLKEKGYVIQHAHEKNRGPVTRIWTPFPEAMPLYVHVSNRGMVQVYTGHLVIKDIKTGNAEFDRAFVVRSNRPEQVKTLLTPHVHARLLKFGDIAFLTGSNESLACANFPNQSKDEGKLRQYWMVVTTGELSDDEAQPFLDFGRELASRVEDLCKDQPASSMKDLTSAPFEGR